MPPDADTDSATIAPSPAEAGGPQHADTHADSGADSQNTQTETAPSSGDKTLSEHEQLLAVVKNAVADKPSADAGDTPADGDKTSGTDSAAGDTRDTLKKDVVAVDENGDPSEDELKTYRPNARNRITQLVRQRNDFRDRLTAAEPEIQAHRQFQTYLAQANLDPSDVNNLLGVGANLRAGNWGAFLQGVLPYVQMAQEALGQSLPNDLQSRVDTGEMTQDAAAEVIRARYRASQAEGEAKLYRDASQRADQTRQYEALHASVTGAVHVWEADIRKRDPDYPAKADAVLRYSQALVQERGVPRNSQEAVAIANEALAGVNRWFGRARPQPGVTRPTPNGASSTTSAATQEPRTLMEAAVAGLRRARASSTA